MSSSRPIYRAKLVSGLPSNPRFAGSPADVQVDLASRLGKRFRVEVSKRLRYRIDVYCIDPIAEIDYIVKVVMTSFLDRACRINARLRVFEVPPLELEVGPPSPTSERGVQLVIRAKAKRNTIEVVGTVTSVDPIEAAPGVVEIKIDAGYPLPIQAIVDASNEHLIAMAEVAMADGNWVEVSGGIPDPDTGREELYLRNVRNGLSPVLVASLGLRT